MSLVPEVGDPNRKAELVRMKEDPKAFDANPSQNLPKDFDAQSSGLVADRDAPTAEPTQSIDEAAELIKAQWLDYLDQPVKDIISELPSIENVEQLEAMLAVETDSKNRVTLIEAINNELQSRKGE